MWSHFFRKELLDIFNRTSVHNNSRLKLDSVLDIHNVNYSPLCSQYNVNRFLNPMFLFEGIKTLFSLPYLFLLIRFWLNLLFLLHVPLWNHFSSYKRYKSYIDGSRYSFPVFQNSEQISSQQFLVNKLNQSTVFLRLDIHLLFCWWFLLFMHIVYLVNVLFIGLTVRVHMRNLLIIY